MALFQRTAALLGASRGRVAASWRPLAAEAREFSVRSEKEEVKRRDTPDMGSTRGPGDKNAKVVEDASKERAREDGQAVSQKLRDGKPGEATKEAGGMVSDMAKGVAQAGKKVGEIASEAGGRLKETAKGLKDGILGKSNP